MDQEIKVGQVWKTGNGHLIKLRKVGDEPDGIVIYPDPADEEASRWAFKTDLIKHCTLVEDVE